MLKVCITLASHWINRQVALIPKFVLLRVVFLLRPCGGVVEAIHEVRYHHLCRLVHQLGHDKQRC